jgi:hypothetical protein
MRVLRYTVVSSVHIMQAILITEGHYEKKEKVTTEDL